MPEKLFLVPMQLNLVYTMAEDKFTCVICKERFTATELEDHKEAGPCEPA